MCIGFVLLARGTAFNVFPHILCEAWPSEFQGDELLGFEITGVSDSLMIMALG